MMKLLDRFRVWFEAVNSLIEEKKRMDEGDISDISEFLKDGVIATKGGEKNEEDRVD